jgi:hypothetical protein
MHAFEHQILEQPLGGLGVAPEINAIFILQLIRNKAEINHVGQLAQEMVFWDKAIKEIRKFAHMELFMVTQHMVSHPNIDAIIIPNIAATVKCKL